ncbi:MAG: excinuclease ABC subunit UvrC [Bacteroidales bacterium]|nr:excinuclease ABC subunit UvrC [Bacteroidales bacterium]
MHSTIKVKIGNIPEKPGVYQFYNQTGEILYIGKAKNLRKRISSYFGKVNTIHYKQKILVSKIHDIKYILVENESDALLLENNLIKEYKPKYNVLLKDDKTFPWICIKNEPFARVFYTRKIINDGSEYFGPYTSVMMIKTLFALIKQLYKLRTCNYSLTQENILKKKYKRCLEYYLENCKAPCEGLQSENDYNASLKQIREILKGNLQQVINHLNQHMLDYADKYEYEKAHLIQQKLEILDKFKAKSTIVNPGINNIDVYSIIDEPGSAYVNYMKLVKGAIIQAHNIEIIKRIEEQAEDVLSFAIFELRNRFNSNSSEIIIPFKLDLTLKGVNFTVPLRGDKKKLLDLSFRNVNSFRIERIRIQESNRRTSFEKNALESLKNELRLKVIPNHIECVDISNIQGKNSVASCVVFKSGKPNKSEYRRYHIKTVSGANDYASIGEIVKRRLRYFKEHQLKFPDLFVIDGGKGQLNAALKEIHDIVMKKQTTFIGIAKRLEEIYIQGDMVPLYIDKNSPGLKMIQRIRNEAHRFGVSFHRNERSKSMLFSELDQIKGIGKITKNKLLQNTKDIETVRKMQLTDLEMIIGKRAGRILYEYLHIKS